MEKELSTMEIVKAADDIKAILKNFDAKRLFYTIYAINPTISEKQQIVVVGDNKEGSCYNKFVTEVDSLLSNKNIVYLKFVFKSGNGKLLSEPEIYIRSKSYGQPIVISPESSLPNQPTTQQVVAQEHHSTMQPTPPIPNNVNGFLSLMGVDVSGLGSPDELGGLGAILAFRDKQIEKKYQDLDRDKRFEELIASKTRLEEQIKQLENEVKTKDAEIVRLKDENEELADENDEYEQKQESNAALLNTGMTALGVIAKKKPNSTIGKVAAALGLIDDEEDEQVSETSISNVEIEKAPDNHPRAKYNDAIKQFLYSISDEDFEKFWTLITAFNKDNGIIKLCYNWATGSNIGEDDNE